jgi:hypothetical protein
LEAGLRFAASTLKYPIDVCDDAALSIALEYVCRVTRGSLYIFSVLNSFTYTKEFHLRWTLGLKGRPTARPVHQDSITQGIDN